MRITIGRRFEIEWDGNLYVRAPWFGGRVWDAYWDRLGISCSTFTGPAASMPSTAQTMAQSGPLA